MKYNLSLKLEDITAVSIAIKLWQQSQRDVRNEMSELEPDDLDRYWNSRTKIRKSTVNSIERRLFKKVSQFSIPLNLRDKIMTAVLSVGNELIHFILDTFDIFTQYPYIRWMNYICWTPFGMIDKQRTTEAFLKRKFLSVWDRYTLACKYICEDFVTVLWKKLPENIDEVNEISCEEQLINFWREEFLYWNSMGPNEERLIADLILVTMENANMTAFSYFWKKLSSEEKEREKLRFVQRSMSVVPVFSMITIVLLNEMNSEQQMNFVGKYSIQLVQYFDFWLLRGFFLPTVEKAMGSITARDYGRLLEMIAQKTIENKWEANKYRRWFLGLWMQSSNDFKKHLITNPPDRLFAYLVRDENFKFIKMILDETTVEERRVLFNKHALQTMCKCLITYDSLKFVVRILTHSFPCDEVGDLVRVMVQTKEVCLDLVYEDQLERLEKLLNYFDDVSAERIVELKRQLVFEVGKDVCRSLVLGNHLPVVEKFLMWGMLKDEEIAEFKRELLRIEFEGEDLCTELLEIEGLEIADDIIRFCFSSEEEIGEYKKGLMLSSFVASMLTTYVDERSWCGNVDETGCCGTLVKIIKWFNVEDKETVKLFIDKFEEEIVDKFNEVKPDYCEKVVDGLHRMVIDYALV